jgi:spore coat protein CotF
MINDYLEIRNAEGMPKMIDTNMALAFLLNSKNSVRNLAIALSETASPEVRKTLRIY